MDYRQLGVAGAFVSRIGLGTTSLATTGRVEAHRLLGAAVDAGINLVHVPGRATAATGEVLGEVLGSRRRDVVLATGLCSRPSRGPNATGQSRLRVMQALEDSLRRLGTDHIDLYHVQGVDPCTPVEETLLALDDAVHQGKVRYIACSGMAAWQVAKALGVSALHGLAGFAAVHVPYSPLGRTVERDLVPMAMAERLALVAHPGRFTAIGATARVATRHGVTSTQVELAWLLGRDAVTSTIVDIAGPGDLAAALAAPRLVLTPADHAELDAVGALADADDAGIAVDPAPLAETA